MKSYIKKIQSGRSMIEMLGVLAIVGVLSAGGIAGYSMAMQSYKTNLLINRMQLLATKIASTYKGNYNALSKQNMISSGKVTAADFINPFGGDMVINQSWADNDLSFWVKSGSTANIPTETCIDILTTDWGKQVNLAEIYDSAGQRVASLHPPETIEAATTACGLEEREVQLRFR